MAEGDWKRISKRSVITGILGLIFILLPDFGMPVVSLLFNLVGLVLIVTSIIFQTKDKSML